MAWIYMAWTTHGLDLHGLDYTWPGLHMAWTTWPVLTWPVLTWLVILHGQSSMAGHPPWLVLISMAGPHIMAGPQNHAKYTILLVIWVYAGYPPSPYHCSYYHDRPAPHRPAPPSCMCVSLAQVYTWPVSIVRYRPSALWP